MWLQTWKRQMLVCDSGLAARELALGKGPAGRSCPGGAFGAAVVSRQSRPPAVYWSGSVACQYIRLLQVHWVLQASSTT